jgi:hypothetical protein
MPRSEARVFCTIWDDPDWLRLSIRARHMYLLLLTQQALTHCGVIALGVHRWAHVAGLTFDEASEDLTELEKVGWVVADYDYDELLVRSLVRRDKVLLQPKLWRPLTVAIGQVRSVTIRCALLAELVRTRAEGGVNAGIAGALDALIRTMEAQLDSLSDGLPGSHPDGLPGTDADSGPASHPDSQGGEGARNGSHQTDPPSPFPKPLTPSPRPAAAGAPRTQREVQPAAEEGDPDRNHNRSELAALIAEVRAIRPEWSTASIRRSLTAPSIAERPWPAVQAAAIVVASDPASNAPGRLAADGPWWNQRPRAVQAPPRPPHCGDCDPETRLTRDADRPARCPACHPSMVTRERAPQEIS